MISKQFRLQNSKDYDEIYKKGQKLRGEYGMLIILRDATSNENPQIGFVVSKKMGNAVQRHLVTRQLRSISYEFLKSNSEELLGSKLSYIAYSNAPSYKSLLNDLNSLFEKSLKV